VKNCVGNDEGISHGQRLVTAGCRVCGMGYEMGGAAFCISEKKCKKQLAFCIFRWQRQWQQQWITMMTMLMTTSWGQWWWQRLTTTTNDDDTKYDGKDDDNDDDNNEDDNKDDERWWHLWYPVMNHVANMCFFTDIVNSPKPIILNQCIQMSAMSPISPAIAKQWWCTGIKSRVASFPRGMPVTTTASWRWAGWNGDDW
jgi:hypothetical protein